MKKLLINNTTLSALLLVTLTLLVNNYAQADETLDEDYSQESSETYESDSSDSGDGSLEMAEEEDDTSDDDE